MKKKKLKHIFLWKNALFNQSQTNPFKFVPNMSHHFIWASHNTYVLYTYEYHICYMDVKQELHFFPLYCSLWLTRLHAVVKAW